MKDSKVISIALKKHSVANIKGYSTNKKYVDYGLNNKVPFILQEFYEQSAIHNTIINSKIKFIVGGGLGDNPTVPNSFDTWDELLFKLESDYELYNGFCYEIVMLKIGYEIYHLPFGKCRTDEDKTTVFYANKDFVTPKGGRMYNIDYEEIPYFNKNKEQPKSVVYYSEYRVGQKVYPLPTYVGGLMAIETDIAITKADLNNVKNGFSAGTIISFNNGEPVDGVDEEDGSAKAKVLSDVNRTMGGEENTGAIFIEFNDNKDNAATIASYLPNNVHKQYAGAAEASKAEIFISHQVINPTMYGVKTSAAFGESPESLVLSWNMFDRGYAKHRRKVLETQLNIAGSLMGLSPFEIIVDPLLEEDVKETTEVVEELSKEHKGSDIAKQLVKLGVSSKGYEIVSFKSLGVSDFDEFGKCQASEGLETFKFADDYGLELEDYEILSALEDNPDTTLTDLSKATKKPIKEIAKIIGMLVLADLIIKAGSTYTNSDIGSDVAKANPVKEFKLKVMYRYAVRDNAPPLKTHSRDFCSGLMAADLLYNKQDINTLENESGTSVWLFKGGWYRSPDSDIAVPFCRHEWQQVVVKDKTK